MADAARVLLVEDSPATAHAARRRLEARGLVVDVVSTLAAALAAASATEYRMLIVDLTLSDAKGVEAVVALAKVSHGGMIVYTGDPTAEDAVHAVAVDAGFAVKGEDDIATKVCEILGSDFEQCVADVARDKGR